MILGIRGFVLPAASTVAAVSTQTKHGEIYLLNTSFPSRSMLQSMDRRIHVLVVLLVNSTAGLTYRKDDVLNSRKKNAVS